MRDRGQERKTLSPFAYVGSWAVACSVALLVNASSSLLAPLSILSILGLALNSSQNSGSFPVLACLMCLTPQRLRTPPLALALALDNSELLAGQILWGTQGSL